MDPNETLRRLRALLEGRRLIMAGNTVDWEASLEYAAELFTALDESLRNDGFLPDAWADSWNCTRQSEGLPQGVSLSGPDL